MKSSDKIIPHSLASTGDNMFDIEIPAFDNSADVEESATVFDEDGVTITPISVPGYDSLKYVPWGLNNDLPYELMKTVGCDEVLAQNLFFNILTTYGAGLSYVDRETKEPTEDKDIRRFMMSNSLAEFFLEQCTDMKYFFFSVAVIILNREQTKIVQIRHKDACYCRFQKADGSGRVNRVFFANWRKAGLTKKDIEVIPLLDEKDPLGDLEVRIGRRPDRDGKYRMTRACKYAVVMRFPTPGQRYYPTPYYTSIFRGDWYDLKRIIGKAKKSKIKNLGSIRYQVEILNDYWDRLIESEGITDPEEIKKRIKKEKENIKQFVTGVQNSGKVWITGYYVDINGKEQRMVRITVVDSGKEGGDWSEDVQEASNMMCYGMNIHPNLVGATPGKSQSNNSGSDKRELFTLKQSLETAFHDMLRKVHDVVVYFNQWEDKVRPQIPIVMLTTLDKNTDAIKVQSDGTTTDTNS